jgi:diaminopimelate epimerase
MQFHKLHGLGNDFVLIETKMSANVFFKNKKHFCKVVSDRKTGVGFDQLLLLNTKKNIPVLEIFNADGSRAEMCGNGLRAVGLYLFSKSKKKQLLVKTDVGTRKIFRCPKTKLIEVEMGKPRVVAQKKYVVVKNKIGISVDVGNPHVVFLDYFPKNRSELIKMGKTVEISVLKRTNVEFVLIQKQQQIAVKAQVWERGVGITEACGSGAVAIARAIKSTRAPHQNNFEIIYPGGTAFIRFDSKQNAYLKAKTEFSFSGVLLSYQSKKVD